MSKLRIHRLKITAYRGVEALDVQVPEHGAVFKGANMKGKTSILSAVRAALAARDISEGAIRHGSDRADILVDLGDVSVQRAIKASGSQLSIKRTATGDTVNKPQHFLNELLGTAPLDPMELFLEKDPKKRRALVLAALPVTVTEADLRGWIPDAIREDYPVALPDLTQHGLEVVKAVHDVIYGLRAQANKDAKQLDTMLQTARADLDTKRKAVPVPEGTPPLDAANVAEAEAEDLYRTAAAQASAARGAEERTAQTRAQITTLRLDATAADEAASQIAVPDRTQIDADMAENERTIGALEASLDDARKRRGQLRDKQLEQGVAADRRARQEEVAAHKRQRADELEAALAEAAITSPTDAELDALRVKADAATAAVQAAMRAAEYAQAQAKIDAAQLTAKAVSDRAGLLTTVVDRLAKEAPAQLLARSKGIEGLGVDGDSITLNDVAMDSLSGREQLVFAVQVCRRLNEKARILICDGLERLDPEQYEVFVHEATHGGWQLIGTRVDRGDVVMEAISEDAHAS